MGGAGRRRRLEINPTFLIRHTALYELEVSTHARARALPTTKAHSELFLVGLSVILQRPLYPHWRWQISLWAEREREREGAGLKQAGEKIRLLLILQILG